MRKNGVRLFVSLSIVLLALLLTQCSRPAQNSGDASGSGAAAPAAGAFPSGISPTGGPGNNPKANPNNPQTNPGTNLDGTQSPRPDQRNSAKAPNSGN